MAGLTANEQEFLRFYARHDDRQARLGEWRRLKLPSYEKSDGTITRRIKMLVRRDDAMVFLETEAERVRENRAAARREADTADWEEQAAKAKLNKAVIQELTRVLRARGQAVIDNPTKSANDLANLAEIAHRISGEASGAPPMTAETRRDLVKDAGLAVETVEQVQAEGDQGAAAPEAPTTGKGEMVFVDPQRGDA